VSVEGADEPSGIRILSWAKATHYISTKGLRCSPTLRDVQSLCWKCQCKMNLKLLIELYYIHNKHLKCGHLNKNTNSPPFLKYRHMGSLFSPVPICLDSQAALPALEVSRIMLMLVWECWQAICALSSCNKVTLIWDHGHSGIEDNEDADAVAREGSSSSFLGPESAIPILSCVGRLKIKESLIKQHSKY
jgi:hypothetical protein